MHNTKSFFSSAIGKKSNPALTKSICYITIHSWNGFHNKIEYASKNMNKILYYYGIFNMETVLYRRKANAKHY